MIGPRGLALIKRFEGCRLEAYRDSKGICTIGYGHTGDDVYDGQCIDQERAASLLLKDLWDAEPPIDRLVKVPLTSAMRDALISWVFNLGAARLENSTMLARLNEQKYLEVPGEMVRWHQTHGSELGLLRRRLAEAALFLEDGLP